MTTIDEDNVWKQTKSYPSSSGVFLPEATDPVWPEAEADSKPKTRVKKTKKKIAGGREPATCWGPLDTLPEADGHEETQPLLLDQIFHAITKLDSQQQLQFEALMSKVNNIEEQVSKASELPGSIGALGGGCLDTSAAEPSTQGPSTVNADLSESICRWKQIGARREKRYRSSQRVSRFSQVGAGALPPLVEVEPLRPSVSVDGPVVAKMASPDMGTMGTCSESVLGLGLGLQHAVGDNAAKHVHKAAKLQHAVSDNAAKHVDKAAKHVETMRVTIMNTSLHIVMAGVIALQAIHIGVSMDHDNDALTILDLVFTVSFIIEMLLKCKLYTVKGFFSSGWSWFDLAVIIIDSTQFVLSQLMNISQAEDITSVALLRMLRVLRLIRVIRLSKLDILKDFSFMVSGIVAGTMTLCWALVLFVIVVYVTSLLFRELFGRKSHVLTCEECADVDIVEYFDSVPRSMMTVFRFFLGDFTSVQGINIYEGIQTSYGALATCLVSTLFFMVSIGVFNVISAIFVERAVAASEKLQKTKKKEKESQLWRTSIETLIRKLFEKRGMVLGNFTVLSHTVEGLANESIDQGEFEEFILEPAVSTALCDLGLDADDLGEFFDMLDNNKSGACTLFDLIGGIKRLQGSARRSDIITIDLMVREIQQQVHILMTAMNTLLKSRATCT